MPYRRIACRSRSVVTPDKASQIGIMDWCAGRRCWHRPRRHGTRETIGTSARHEPNSIRRTSAKVRPADKASHPAADATRPPPAGTRRLAVGGRAAAAEPASARAPRSSRHRSYGQFRLHPSTVRPAGARTGCFGHAGRGNRPQLDDAVIGRVEFGAMDSAVQAGLPEDGTASNTYST